jgi:hypothetical protein
MASQPRSPGVENSVPADQMSRPVGIRPLDPAPVDPERLGELGMKRWSGYVIPDSMLIILLSATRMRFGESGAWFDFALIPC